MLRATLKSLLARKLRLALSTLAVVLSVMFVSGSLVLTDTLGRTFDNLFSTIYTYTDVRVSAKAPLGDAGERDATPVPASLVDRVGKVDGVAKAKGVVFLNGAVPIGKNNKAIVNGTGQQFGAGWGGEDELLKLAEGSAPSAPDEIVVNKSLAADNGYKVGDSMDVLTRSHDQSPRATYKIVGLATYAGGRGSLAGESTIFFTMATAQKVMLGGADQFNVIDVKAASGVGDDALRDRIQAQLGGDYLVKTGKDLSKESSDAIKGLLKYFNYVLLGFAAVALLVGVFLILNTFSIIVAQRTQELALLRAMGAARGQVMRSVLLEALIIGVVGSALGFLAGLGVGAAGAAGLGALVGHVDVASLGAPASAIIASFTIGILVTMVAAITPALKAARVAPIAAMRESATPDRPLTRLTVIGGVITALAIGSLVWGLAGAGGATLSLVFGGVLGVLIGVALLTPMLGKPLVAGLGSAFSWFTSGMLGKRNSARNPRRTAITAGAVMIGIAIVTAISTIFTSLSAALGDQIDNNLQADIIVFGQQTSQLPPVLTDDEVQRITQLPDAATVATLTADRAKVDGNTTLLSSYLDPAAAVKVLKRKAVEGRIDRIDAGEFIVDEKTAEDSKYHLGDTITVQFSKGQQLNLKLVGITAESAVGRGIVVSYADAKDGFAFPQAWDAFVDVKDGASVEGVKNSVNDVLKDNPQVSAYTKDEYVQSSQLQFDVVLGIVQVLLLVALAIAVLGVINTLLLSVIERTRELGMLRAVGLRRSQTWLMVTTESVVITVFGTVLGLAVGVGLGAAIVTALKSVLGFGTVTLPWVLMVVYLFAAIIVGAVAGFIPSLRAMRLNVLRAIAYE